MFFSRALFQWLKLATRLEQDVHAREDSFPKFFDNIEADGFRPSDRFNPHKGKQGKIVEPGVRVGICVHQTAVKFGTTRRSREKWRRRAVARGMVVDSAATWGSRMALHERFWKVPYHVVSLLNGDVLLNNKLSHYTYHGNGANHLLYGWAMEGSFPGLESGRKSNHHVLDDFTIETGRAGIRLLILKARKRGDDIHLVLPHRTYKCPGRAGDPGEAIWQEIVIPQTKAMQVYPDYERRVGTGLQVPIEWDRNATHDYRGRRVA